MYVQIIPSPDQDFTLARYEARMRRRSHHFNMMRYEPGVLEASGIELVAAGLHSLGVPMYVAGTNGNTSTQAPLPRGLGSKIPRAAARHGSALPEHQP